MKYLRTQKQPVANCGLGNIACFLWRLLICSSWSSAARPITVCHQNTASVIRERTLGLCDMDKKIISRFFYFFIYFGFNHDFDTNRHALSYTSYLFFSHLVFAHLTCLAHLVLHFSLFYYTFISFFYLYICFCVVLILYNLYSLHCPLSGPDLIYISLLIIPCIIYHVTNKETLTFTVIHAFCVNLKNISKGNQLDLSQKVVTCL